MSLSFVKPVFQVVVFLQFIGISHQAFALTNLSPEIYIENLKQQKSQIFQTQQESLILPNGLRLLLVSDPRAKESACTVSVNTGFVDDPVAYRGLAHYLEHMLFLGSQKYPDKEEFLRFVNERSGKSNAFTTDEDTNFFLTIGDQDFAAAVDRLAQFFIEPRFDEKYLEKELSQIQSEYDTNVQDSDFFLPYMRHLNLKKEHPLHWSFQGNRETLGHVPREVMRDFFWRHYSADNMNVAIVSSLPLRELKKLSEVFSRVPRRGTQKGPILPTADAITPTVVKIKSALQTHHLFLYFTLPPAGKSDWQTKNYEILASRLDEDAPGTLSSFLKEQGLIYDIGSGVQNWRGWRDLYVSSTLTESGVAQWEQIASTVLAYIADLQKTRLSEALAANEKRRRELSYLYDFVSPVRSAVSLARGMGFFDPQEVETNQTLIPAPSADDFHRQVQLLNPQHTSIYLISPTVTAQEKPEFYQFSYSVDPIDKYPWIANPRPISGFKTSEPTTNPYLPRNLGLISVQNEKPHEIVNLPGVSVTHYPSIEFKQPLASLILDFRFSKDFPPSSRSAAISLLLNQYLDLALKKPFSEAHVAGYGWSLLFSSLGGALSVTGYSDHLESVSLAVAGFFRNLRIDEAELRRQATLLQKLLAQKEFEESFKQALWLRTSAVDPHSVEVEKIQGELSQITAKEVEEFKSAVFRSGRFRFLAFGNLDESQSRKLSQEVMKVLESRPSEDVVPLKITEYPVRGSAFSTTRPGENHAWLAEFQVPDSSVKSFAKAHLLGALLNMKFFEDMRTEQELGYVTQLGVQDLRTGPSLLFLIQTAKPLLEINKSCNSWIAEAPRVLNSMPAETFESARTARISQLRKGHSSFVQKFLSVAINFSNEWSFDREEQEAFELEKLTLPDLVSYYTDYVLGPQRRQFTIFLTSTSNGSTAFIPQGVENVVTDLSVFRRENSKIIDASQVAEKNLVPHTGEGVAGEGVAGRKGQ
ncbi:MAG: hypothetical protein C5B49_12480 [Bdellovibrio sp.]|nr:MAG: hypothetical protein C5B49_12480 [Bdellovibrio sp.]